MKQRGKYSCSGCMVVSLSGSGVVTCLLYGPQSELWHFVNQMPCNCSPRAQILRWRREYYLRVRAVTDACFNAPLQWCNVAFKLLASPAAQIYEGDCGVINLCLNNDHVLFFHTCTVSSVKNLVNPARSNKSWLHCSSLLDEGGGFIWCSLQTGGERLLNVWFIYRK